MTGKKIYLSPSKQASNIYAEGNTNEKAEMEDLAGRIKGILDSEYECECVIAAPALGIDKSGRPKEARDFGCSIYLAIHSNAGGGGKASGAVAYYHPSQSEGKALASNIVRELNSICPVKSNRAAPVASGMTQYGGQGLGEIRNPAEYGLIAVLSETDFHDNPRVAEWIVSSKDKMARAYVKALTDTFQIPGKGTNSALKAEQISESDQASQTEKVSGIGQAPSVNQVPPAGAKPKYYKVQVGAFSRELDAEAMLRKLKTSGFDGYVKFE